LQEAVFEGYGNFTGYKYCFNIQVFRRLTSLEAAFYKVRACGLRQKNGRSMMQPYQASTDSTIGTTLPVSKPA